MTLPPLPRADIFDPGRFGIAWHEASVRAYGEACAQAERERAALLCDDEARLRTEAGRKHPDGSEAKGRCFAAARAAINCAKGVRSGEIVDAIRDGTVLRLLAAERERCAKLCEDADTFCYDNPGGSYAAAIRQEKP